ncbi:hypothetical protein BGZ61DRAFT_462788 [Ilyonectria robusta]|uniref:uncharacterized protein n=1 Tax=Ilyonectria robusta TaxID=1079257 RepID=UPI001E8D33B9|nr:uncharacterized protein BGZ61DRAFT_462788 [Ilyonectria robusta]KAH8663247.1 hypothetical protein BGZ61DRAFT_462788 [Ilyonectria robusta]
MSKQYQTRHWHTWFVLLLWCIVFPSSVIGQQSAELTQLIASVPDCAQPCLALIFQNGDCTLAGLPGCLCSSVPIQANVSACVQLSCAFKDQTTVATISKQLCTGYPIESQSREVKTAAIACAALAFPIVALRCVARWMVTKKLWLDDWTAVMATVLLAALIGVQIESTNLGFGRHYWNVDVVNGKTILQMFYVTQIFYILIQVSAKGSILALYSRLFSNRNFRMQVWAVAVFLLSHSLVFVGLVIFQCTPISSIWNRNLDGKCLNLTAIGYAGAAFSIVEDIVLLIMPIPELLKLQLGTRKKAALLFMFSIGSFACVTTLVRLKYLVSFANSLDTTFDNVPIVIWSIIELSCALICASLPALRPLIHMVPGALSTVRSSSFKNTTGPGPTDNTIQLNAIMKPERQSTKFQKLPDHQTGKFKKLPDLPQKG